MDTNLPSPKLSGSKRTASNDTGLLTNVFSAAIAIGAVVLAVGSMSGVAQAQTAAKPATAVSYADLDLSTHDGARVLLKRINSAAKEACGPAPVMSPLTPAAATLHDRCVEQAADKAVADVNAPLLVALHTGAPQSAGELFAAR
ncbi:MAG: UrcA family protein [Burkholderiales bacterium]|nr:MAG: UrcA family protein [Burkholderiales bacterium]